MIPQRADDIVFIRRCWDACIANLSLNEPDFEAEDFIDDDIRIDEGFKEVDFRSFKSWFINCIVWQLSRGRKPVEVLMGVLEKRSRPPFDNGSVKLCICKGDLWQPVRDVGLIYGGNSCLFSAMVASHNINKQFSIEAKVYIDPIRRIWEDD
ncbi:hypothetical protein SDJN02_19756, partial [Cucurbita argyrosperma subsp. argyrosperma]